MTAYQPVRKHDKVGNCVNSGTVGVAETIYSKLTASAGAWSGRGGSVIDVFRELGVFGVSLEWAWGGSQTIN